MDNSYSIFLMSQLAIAHGEIDKDLEYDLMWAEAQTLLERFEASKYNTDLKSEIDCMNNYLESFKNPVPTITRPSINTINEIIDALDYYARDFDSHDYGLPVGEEHVSNMCKIIKDRLGM